jgi:hypothetical protein
VERSAAPSSAAVSVERTTGVCETLGFMETAPPFETWRRTEGFPRRLLE